MFRKNTRKLVAQVSCGGICWHWCHSWRRWDCHRCGGEAPSYICGKHEDDFRAEFRFAYVEQILWHGNIVYIFFLWEVWNLAIIFLFIFCARSLAISKRPRKLRPTLKQLVSFSHKILSPQNSSRGGWRHQNGWIFGKVPNGLWPTPFIFGKT